MFRDGYAGAGDSGAPLEYAWSASACPLNAGAGDNGWQVQPNSGGGCWTASLPTSGADIRLWGATSAASDNSTAFLAAANAASAGKAGGLVLVPPSAFKVAQSANLDLSPYPNIRVGCVGGTVGLQTGSNLTAPCTLQVNPAYSISLGRNQEVYGLRIVNGAIDTPATIRAGLTAVAAFAGTGVVANANDVSIHDVTINGFSQAVTSTNAQRVKLDNVVGDDTSFVSLNGCNDTCQVSRLEAWNFLTTALGGANYAVTGVSSGPGGAAQITTGAQNPALVTGDVVVVSGLGGTGQPVGRYTITVVDATDFTLNGTTYAAGYTSGGNVNLATGRRTGTAFSFTGANVGGESAASLWEYGHDTCVAVGPQHGPTDIHYLWCDGPTANGSYADSIPVGINYQGYGSGVFGGAILNKAISVYANSTDAILRPFTVNGVTGLSAAGCKAPAAASSGAAVTVAAGSVLLSNSYIAGMNLCPAGYAAFSVASGAGPLKISNTNLYNGASVSFATASDCLNSSIDGASRGCAPATGTTACTVGQTAYDGTTLYVCTATNAWRKALTSDFSGNVSVAGALGVTGNTTLSGTVTVNGQQTTIQPSATTGNAALVVKSNDGGATGMGAQIQMFDNYAGLSIARKYLRLDYRGHFQIVNDGYTASIFDLDDSGNLKINAGLTTTGITLTSLAATVTAPTISSGFCTSPAILHPNGTSAFQITIGSSCAASTGVLTMPAASNGWTCNFRDVTNPAGNKPDMTASSATGVSVANYNRTTGAALNWTAGDTIDVDCHGF